jgi:DNA-3-methyladenine glycosylase II
VLLILEQQVSIDSAKATFKIKGKDKNLRPDCFMDLSDQEFRSIGVSRQKHLISKALSAVISKNIDLPLVNKTPLQCRRTYQNQRDRKLDY